MIDPIVKRFLLGIDIDIIKDVYGMEDKEFTDYIHDYLSSNAPTEYALTKDGRGRAGILTLQKSAKLFYRLL